MSLVAAFLFTFFMPVYLHAVDWSSKDLCTDLGQAACQEKTIDDGTGSGTNLNNEEGMQRIRELLRPGMAESVLKDLNSPAGNAPREIACKAFGVSPCSAEAIAPLVSEEILHKTYQDWGTAEYPSAGGRGVSIDAEMMDVLYKTPFFVRQSENLKTKASELMGLGKLEDKIEKSLLPQVLAAFHKIIETKVADPKAREIMLARIDKTFYKRGTCGQPSQAHADPTLDNLEWPMSVGNISDFGFFFSCGLLMRSDSELGIVATMGHELGHLIDPCKIANPISEPTFRYSSADTYQNADEYPVAGLVKCLRQESSVHSAIGGNEGIAPNLPQIGICHQQDGASENTCDWFGAEVLAEYLKSKPALTGEQVRKGMVNLFNPICSYLDKPSRPGSPYPEFRARISRTFMANPILRERTGCKDVASPVVYCGPEASPAATGSPSGDGSNVRSTR